MRDELQKITPDVIRMAVAARRDWGIAALQQVIRVDSVAPDEKACQETLQRLLVREGLPARLCPLDEVALRATPGYIEAGLPLTERPNLVVELGGRGGRSLILNSHIDTVPWREDRDRWRSDPLGGEVRDGRIYGRGAVDAKGQVLTAIMAVLALRDMGFEPDGRLVVESVVGEEPEGNGTLDLCRAGWTADAAIVLEPTGNQVAYGHRGIVGLQFVVEGAAGHAAVQGSTENPILAAGRLLDRLRGALTDWTAPGDGVYGPPTLNIGQIMGGDDIFSIPRACEITCGLRYAPGTYDHVMRHILDRLDEAGGQYGVNRTTGSCRI